MSKYDKSILEEVNQGIKAIEALRADENLQFIEDFSKLLAKTFSNGGKLIVAGNGGSLCDAMHFAEELTGYFRKKRKALPAIVLSEPGHMSCVGNDAGFDTVFSRGVEAFGKPEDIFCGLTTSGNSPNIVLAHKAAKKLGLKTVLFLGKGGGKLKQQADLELCVDGFETSDRIQEAHMAAIHITIHRMESILFGETDSIIAKAQIPVDVLPV